MPISIEILYIYALIKTGYGMTVFLLIIALVLIVAGAELLVEGSAEVAKRYHVSEFVIGMIIVGIGTSMPELSVSLVGALDGNGDVAIGNVVGSNIVNILLILGVTALIRPIPMTSGNIKVDIPQCLIISVLLYLFAFGFTTVGEGRLSRVEGAVFMVIFVLFVYNSFRSKEHVPDNEQKPVKKHPMWLSVVMIAGGLAGLIFGGRMFVNSAIKVATALGVSQAVISITILAVGTSLPELTASIVAASKGRMQMALGNIVGSNIFNIVFILGVCSLVTPLPTAGITRMDMYVMIGAALLLLVAAFSFRRKELDRVEGLIMIAAYAAYLFMLLSRI